MLPISVIAENLNLIYRILSETFSKLANLYELYDSSNYTQKPLHVRALFYIKDRPTSVRVTCEFNQTSGVPIRIRCGSLSLEQPGFYIKGLSFGEVPSG